MTCARCQQWEAYGRFKERELRHLYDLLAELDPGYAATKAGWEATQADPEKMAWLAEQAARLDERTQHTAGVGDRPGFRPEAPPFDSGAGHQHTAEGKAE